MVVLFGYFIRRFKLAQLNKSGHVAMLYSGRDNDFGPLRVPDRYSDSSGVME